MIDDDDELISRFATPDERLFVAAKATKGKLKDWQIWALLHTASSLPRFATGVDIGTYYGRSAKVFLLATDDGFIVSLTPDPAHIARAAEELSSWIPLRCSLQETTSAAFFVHTYNQFDWVFVDGDHGPAVLQDARYWDRLRPGGVMIFHDYSPGRFPYVIRAVERVRSHSDCSVEWEAIDREGAGMIALRKSSCTKDG